MIKQATIYCSSGLNKVDDKSNKAIGPITNRSGASRILRTFTRKVKLGKCLNLESLRRTGLLRDKSITNLHSVDALHD